MLMPMNTGCAFMTCPSKRTIPGWKWRTRLAPTMQGHSPQATGRERKTHRATVHTTSERYTTQSGWEAVIGSLWGFGETKHSDKLHDTLKTRAHCLMWMHVMFCFEWLNVFFFLWHTSFRKWGWHFVWMAEMSVTGVDRIYVCVCVFVRILRAVAVRCPGQDALDQACETRYLLLHRLHTISAKKDRQLAAAHLDKCSQTRYC